MKAIMLSIKPEWVGKIHSKEKIGELRTRIPTCELPFKVYVYETKGTYWSFYTTSNPVLTVPNGGKVEKVRNGEYRVWYKQRGRAKVVSEFIVKTYDKYTDLNNPMNRVRILERCLVDSKELWKYSKKGTIPVFDLHIDDLKIYDEPKPIEEFGIKRPPQSWQFIGGQQ